MPEYQIRNVSVSFPYEAYPVQVRFRDPSTIEWGFWQLTYMEHVLQAIQEKKHALLESPTGTGKTLCLLCATLAWRQSEASKTSTAVEGVQNKANDSKGLPPIVYASRTHSQLNQAVKEIHKTKYKVRSTILASRQQQCCNSALNKFQGTAKNHACTSLVRSKNCEWYRKADTMQREEVYSCAFKNMDIEDMHRSAKKGGPCPFFLSRKIAEKCDIVFVPYQYLVNKRSRKSLGSITNWTNAIVIFDEAHNIEDACTDAASFDLPISVLTNVVAELQRGKKLCSNRLHLEPEIESEDKKRQTPALTKSWAKLSTLIDTLMKMADTLESNLRKMPIPEIGKSFEGEHIFKIFSDVGIIDINWAVLRDALRDTSDLLSEGPHSTRADQTTLGSRLNGNSCSFFAEALEKAFDTKKDQINNEPPLHASFRLHISKETMRVGAVNITLSYWCMSPGIAMKNFVREEKIGSVLLTSGTLSPLDTFANELQIPFPIRLENDHVVDRRQIIVSCVSAGPGNCPLDSSFKCRDEPRYKQDLGYTVVQFLKLIPGGVLMFFPSYVVMKSIIDFWKSSKQNEKSIWDRIVASKSIVVEPRNPEDFASTMKKYQNFVKASNSRGCIFFAVCRGKVSEGINFSDQGCRAVIVSGIPYAPLKDPKVMLKKDFLDCQTQVKLSGKVWYCQTAIRAVNQAIGRVIRHVDDFGTILLCDRRFKDRGIQNQLSKWLRGFIVEHPTFGNCIQSINDFFKIDRSKMVKAEVMEERSPDSGTSVDNKGWKRERAEEEDGSFSVKKQCFEADVKKEDAASKEETLEIKEVFNAEEEILEIVEVFDVKKEVHHSKKEPKSEPKSSNEEDVQ